MFHDIHNAFRNCSTPMIDIVEFLGEQFGCPTVRCMVCEDLVVGEPTLKAPCGHNYCVDCIRDLVTSCMRDEALYPPKCCLQMISPESITPFLTINLSALFDSKRAELDVPPPLRVFCPQPTCSAFLGAAANRVALHCNACRIDVCSGCRLQVHAGESCAENAGGTTALKKLAEVKSWQKCPGCLTFVERTTGCPHILCRCGAQFCYGCGARWKTCKCAG